MNRMTIPFSFSSCRNFSPGQIKKKRLRHRRQKVCTKQVNLGRKCVWLDKERRERGKEKKKTQYVCRIKTICEVCVCVCVCGICINWRNMIHWTLKLNPEELIYRFTRTIVGLVALVATPDSSLRCICSDAKPGTWKDDKAKKLIGTQNSWFSSLHFPLEEAKARRDRQIHPWSDRSEKCTKS